MGRVNRAGRNRKHIALARGVGVTVGALCREREAAWRAKDLVEVHSLGQVAEGVAAVGVGDGGAEKDVVAVADLCIRRGMDFDHGPGNTCFAGVADAVLVNVVPNHAADADRQQASFLQRLESQNLGWGFRLPSQPNLCAVVILRFFDRQRLLEETPR